MSLWLRQNHLAEHNSHVVFHWSSKSIRKSQEVFLKPFHWTDFDRRNASEKSRTPLFWKQNHRKDDSFIITRSIGGRRRKKDQWKATLGLFDVRSGSLCGALTLQWAMSCCSFFAPVHFHRIRCVFRARSESALNRPKLFSGENFGAVRISCCYTTRRKKRKEKQSTTNAFDVKPNPEKFFRFLTAQFRVLTSTGAPRGW